LSLTAGDYTAFVLDANNCAQSFEFTLVEGEELFVDLGDDILVELGGSTILSTIIENNQGDIQYFWDAPNIGAFSCIDCPNPKIENIVSSFSATVTVMDEFGCQGRAFINVTPIEDRAISVPTGFTPNGDAVNDRLLVFGGDQIEILRFEIFDRWGERVYITNNTETNSATDAWDGTINGERAPEGTYVWIAEYRLESTRTEFAKGQTLLIR